jgi:hypothetical protein
MTVEVIKLLSKSMAGLPSKSIRCTFEKGSNFSMMSQYWSMMIGRHVLNLFYVI